MQIYSTREKLRVINRVIACILGIMIAVAILSYAVKDRSQQVFSGPFHITDINGTDGEYDSLNEYSSKTLRKGDWIEISAIIPDSENIVDSVMMDVSFMKVEVSIDGKVVYTNVNNLDEARYVSCIYHIPIDDNAKGKQINIRFSSSERISSFGIPDIYIGELNSGYIEFIDMNIVKISCALIFFFIGVVVALVELFMHNFSSSHKKLIYLALYSVSGSVWIFSITNVMDLLGLGDKVMYWTEYLSVFATGISLTLYLALMMKEDKKIYKKAVILTRVQIAFVIVSSLLEITKISSFHNSLPVYHIILMVSIAIGMYELIKKMNKKKKSEYVFLIMTGATLVSIIILLARYYISSKTMLFSNSGMPYIIIFFNLVIIVQHGYDVVTSYMGNAQVNSLETLAYTDALTGLANRNRCEKQFHMINDKSIGQFNIIMFDVNGLKYVNDTFGHQYGDELIATFAKALKNVFKDERIFTGRMGGDEFVVIIDEEIIEKTERLLENLNKYTKHINTTNQYKYNISYSYGIALCDRTRNNDVWKKFSQADSHMYEMKK